MPPTDDASKRLRKIDISDLPGLQLWAVVLNVKIAAVILAVNSVGTDALKVQQEIEAHPQLYKSPTP